MKALLVTQILLALGLVPLALLRVLAVSPRASARSARLLLVAALVLPWLPLSRGVAIEIPAQVAAVPGAGILGIVSEERQQSAGRPDGDHTTGVVIAALALAGSLAAAGAALVGGIRLANRVGTASRIRRLGHVEIRVGPGLQPFGLWWPGRALVCLDAATASRPEWRRLAAAHEIQHHRAGDTRWAWALLALCVAFPWNPAVWLWSRWIRELEEMAVDAQMIRRFPRRLYSNCLVDAASNTASFAPSLAHRTLLHRRIHMMHRTPRPAALATLVAALSLFAFTGAAVAGGSSFRASRADVAEVARHASHSGFVASAHPVVRERLQRLAGTDDGRAFLTRGLDNQRQYQALVDGALADAGLPPQLAAIPLVESSYTNLGVFEPGLSGAPGRPGKGLWMFIPATARTYGLRVDATSDERLDVRAETGAAVRLLADLHDEFGDWALAVAAYNMGPGKVRQAVDQEGTTDAFELVELGLLNHYVATTYAAVLVLEDPARFGF